MEGAAARAAALHQAGRLAEAVPLYAAALRAAPRDAALLGLFGALRVQLGETAAGAALLRRAVALAPGDAGARFNLGVALVKLGKPAEAAAAFAAVVAAQPGNASAWRNLGHATRDAGRPAEAIAAYRRSLAIEPRHPATLGNLGGVLNRANDPAAAEAVLRQAIALAPDDPRHHNNLGVALQDQEREGEAEAAFRAALALAPNHQNALENLGALLLRARPEAAEPLLRQALAQLDAAREAPDGMLVADLLKARAVLCDWRDREALLARLQVTPGGRAAEPMALLWHADAPARHRRLAEARAADVLAGLAAPALPPRRPGGGGPIRLGYLSPDFGDHPTSALVAEVLELHDRDAFALHGYAVGPRRDGPMRDRIAAALPGLVQFGPVPPETLAARIAADGIDVLVDLAGWTAHARADALALRPAPVQVAWLGYPGTTGAPWIDYAIVDGIAAPQGADRHFTEALVRLPHCYQPNDRLRPGGFGSGPAPGRAAEGLPPTGPVLCCFCQPTKITPAVFGAWLRILAAVPGAVLWLLAPGAAAEAALRAAACAAEVDPARLVFAPRAPQAEHLARYRLADLALDTFPYGSHTTASDALWAGCPQLALTGEGFAARVSTSILHAAGLADLAAPSLAAFEALAIRLAGDPAALRGRVAAARGAPLFDTPRFTRQLEAAYRAMLARAAAGQKPAAIAIPAG